MPEFNACTEWLGIPADKLPANHYALLGVVQFESDLDAIRTALIERQDLVKSAADEAHREDARKLSDELNTAAECLLDPDAKTAYDQQLLEAKFFSTPQPRPVAAKSAEPAVTKAAEPPAAKPTESVAAATPTAPARSESPEPALRVPAPTAEDSESAAIRRPAGRPADGKPVRGMPNPTELASAAKPSREPVLADPFDFSHDDDVSATKVKCPECGVTLKLKNRISLGESHPCPSCEIPFVLDADSIQESYQLDPEGMRAAPERPKPKPVRKRARRKTEPQEEQPVTRGAAAEQSDLLPQKKKKPKTDEPLEPEPPQKRRRKLFDLKNNPAGTGLTVGGIVAAVMLLFWLATSPGNLPLPAPIPAPYDVADSSPGPQRSESAPRRATSDPDADGPESNPDSQPNTPPRADQTTIAPTDDPEAPGLTETAEALKRIVDLISLADPTGPSVTGNWTKEDGALSAAGAGLAHLPIEVGLPDAYELILEVDDVRGNNGVHLGLQVANQHVMAVIDGWSGQASGLTAIDGRPADANESSAFGRWLSPDEPNVIHCSVGKDFVRITCNELPVVDWQGDAASLQLPSETPRPTKSAVFLATDNTAYRVTRFELSSSVDLPEGPQSLASGEDSVAPMPSTAALTEAAALVREVFQSDINEARTPAEKLALAERLLEQGQDKSNNGAGARFIMLKRARDLAVFAGDVDRTLAIMAVMKQDFRINTHSSRAAVFEALRTTARTPQTLVALADTTAKAAREAIDVEDFEAANAMLKTIVAISERLRGRELQTVLAELRRNAADRQVMAEQFTAASTSLKANPYDSAAWFARGRYLCFARSRWRAGLQAFSRTSIDQLVQLARRDLANSTDPQDQLQLADDWWDWIQSDNKRTEFGVFPHYWYSQAAPALAGLTKAKADKRIEQLGTPRRARTIQGSPQKQPAQLPVDE